MTDPVIKQYFGPSRRLGRACVEMSFASEGRRVESAALARMLALADLKLPLPPADDLLELAHAVGVLACVAFDHPLPSEWSWGTEGNMAWVCLSHPHPRIAALALQCAHEAALDCLQGKSALPDSFLDLARRVASLNLIAMDMRRSAALLKLELTLVSQMTRIYQVGQAARGIHFLEMAHEADSITSQVLASDKRATIELLNRVGLPTTTAASLENHDQIADAITQVGLPCVVKPIRSGKGKGISARLQTEAQVRAAVDYALECSSFPVLLENHVEGDDHRLTVVGGHLLWAYRLRPAYVTGDGKTTIGDLIVTENQRRHAISHTAGLYPKQIVIDDRLESFIRDQYDLAADSIAQPGLRVYLAGPANVALGGTLKDVTGDLHPDNRMMALQIARLFRSSALGIDFMTGNIARSWREEPSAVIEVNVTPGLSNLGDASLAMRTIMPRLCSGRVPSFVILGDETARAPIVRHVQQAMAGQRLAAGSTVYRPERTVAQFGGQVAPSAYSGEVDQLLLRPNLDALIILCDPDGVERHGLPLQYCDVLFAPEADALPDHLRASARSLCNAQSAEEVAEAIAAALQPYRDGTLGGPRATLEMLPSVSAGRGRKPAFQIRCWRTRALPRGWFWRQLPGGPQGSSGMVRIADIFAAMAMLAEGQLHQAGHPDAALDPDFTVPEETWDTLYIDATIPMPGSLQGKQQAIVEQALKLAIDKLNQLFGAGI